ncbi:hypothetical protein [Legionella sp.]|uniref:hypothetical protein n=1 Tax=Legionella sp. TaxID=459 RepID=UPI000CBE1331|nr:hypothetical protein [Legionella sp.]PJE09019.1 MAG: hypothetical protein CK430_11785 [Legionella sp.]
MLNTQSAQMLLNLELEIKKLEKLQIQVTAEKKKFQSNANKLTGLVATDLDKLRIQTNNISSRLAQITQELNSLYLTKNLLTTTESPSVERIIIGAGVSGTALFAELPQTLRKKVTPQGFPAVLVLNDPANSNQWHKDGNTLMGQPAKVQTPQVFSSHSEDFAKDKIEARNPYQYVMADDFDQSLVCSQDDLMMQVLHASASSLETFDAQAIQPDWDDPKSLHRIKITLGEETRYIYTNHIDLCTGPGPTRKLMNSQIAPPTAQKLIKQNNIIYGQDKGNAELAGRIVFYGGGGRNAAMILDILNGYQPKVTEFNWIARNGEDFDTNSMFNRMFQDLDADPRCKMQLGELLKIEELSAGELTLSFGKPTKARKNKTLDEAQKTIVCDHLVVSIGQEPHPLTKNLKGFLACQLENEFPGIPSATSTNKSETEIIPLGTYSPDGSIMAWGAAGALGTGLNQNKAFIDGVQKHAEKLPRESRATVGIFRSSWTIPKMVEILSSVFPDKFSAETHRKVHSLDMPDINHATRGELFELISVCMEGDLTPKECLELTDKILDLRSKEPLGIDHPDRLKDKVPDKVLLQLNKQYFIFHNEPAIVQPKVKVAWVAPKKAEEEVKISSNPSTLFGVKAKAPPKIDEFDAAIEKYNSEEVDSNIELPFISQETEATSNREEETSHARLEVTPLAI